MAQSPWTTRLVALSVLALIGGCSGSDSADAGTSPDAMPRDAAIGMDAEPTDAMVDVDAGLHDSGEILDAGGLDAAAPDAAPHDAGVEDRVGALSGTCGVLDDELTSATPHVIENAIDFVDGYDEVQDVMRLSSGAQEILQDGTAGGSSGLSEAFAFEVLERCEGAVLVKSETEIDYDPPNSKKTDILVEIDGVRIGVSVTRAVAFPFDDPYPVERARALLEDKLADVLVSSANVVTKDAWQKQILHVIAYGPMHGMSIATAATQIAPEIRADTIVWVTVTNGDDDFLY